MKYVSYPTINFLIIILFNIYHFVQLTDFVCQSGPGSWPSLVYAKSALYPMGSSANQVFPWHSFKSSRAPSNEILEKELICW